MVLHETQLSLIPGLTEIYMLHYIPHLTSRFLANIEYCRNNKIPYIATSSAPGTEFPRRDQIPRLKPSIWLVGNSAANTKFKT